MFSVVVEGMVLALVEDMVPVDNLPLALWLWHWSSMVAISRLVVYAGSWILHFEEIRPHADFYFGYCCYYFRYLSYYYSRWFYS